MPIDHRFLTLTQWLSPAYPIGAFAYSHGIEQAIHEGWISDATALEDWLRICLTDGSARSDAIFLNLAFEADDLTNLNAQALAFAASRERLLEAERQGAAFVRTTKAVWQLDLPDLLLPLAVGAAAGKTGLDCEATAALYLQSFVSNLVAAAMRLMPLGQTEGQDIIAVLQPVCLTVAKDTLPATLEDIHSNAFLSDISAMRHETLQPRLFRS